MNYEHIQAGTFLSRPNRFIAHVDVKGCVLICHVKNTGRCKELLVPGATVILEYHPNAAGEGYEAYVLFVIQMNGIRGFKPNDDTHPAFGDALRNAARKGVHVLAYDCIVTPDTMTVDEPVAVILGESV